MKQKTAITIIIVVVTLFVLGGIFIPRAGIWFLTKQMLPNIGTGAEYFTEYSVQDSSYMPISFEGLTVSVPSNYVQKEIALTTAAVYQKADESEQVLIIAPQDLSDMNLLSYNNFEASSSNLMERVGWGLLIKGFEDLGNGLPDSAYGTFKCCALLDETDYSFWNLNQSIAYALSGVLKNSLASFGNIVYIYETDDICGIIHINSPVTEGENYRIMMDVFQADDLNTAHSLMIRVPSLDTAYAIINSLEID